MFSTILFLLSLAILYYVIRYRVYVHFSIEVSNSPRRRPGSARVMPTPIRTRQRGDCRITGQEAVCPAQPAQDSVVWGDIASGLVNLGAKKGAAEKAARKAVQQHPDASFDIQFSVALQEVRAA